MKTSIALRAMFNPSSFTCIGRSKAFSPRNAKHNWHTLLRPGLRKKLGFCSSIPSLDTKVRFSSERGRHYRVGEAACVGNGGARAGNRDKNIGLSVVWPHPGMDTMPGARHLWSSTSLQMGRRSAKIATKKGAQDKKKAKLYGRIGKQIVAAVKDAGPNPVSNVPLATLLQTAKDYNIPKDIVERNIKKAGDKTQQDFEELTYEVYGFGGVGIVLEVLTDNNNRAAANIRGVVKKSGGKMAEKGSVLFNFKRTGVIFVKSSGTSGDEVLMAAMDAGADDVIEPEEDLDEDEFEGEKYHRVLTPVDQYWTVAQKLKEAGLPVDIDNSGLELYPVATVKPDDEAEELNRAMIEKLLDLDDVDAVFSNQG